MKQDTRKMKWLVFIVTTTTGKAPLLQNRIDWANKAIAFNCKPGGRAGRRGGSKSIKQSKTKITLVMYSNPWISLWNMGGFHTWLNFRGGVRNPLNIAWFPSLTGTDVSVEHVTSIKTSLEHQFYSSNCTSVLECAHFKTAVTRLLWPLRGAGAS